MKSATPYTPPVNQLLALDLIQNIEDWSHYLELGITEADIPELARMAIDDHLFNAGDDDYFGIIHAWRVLAELQTDQSIEPLITALIHWGKEEEWWDWESEEMPVVFGRLGARALPALAEVMANTTYDSYARHDSTNCVKEILERNPDSREACLKIFMEQLEQFANNDRVLNAYLVTILAADMKALEAAELIERAYGSGRVDLDFIGDWDDAQVYLGLKEKSEIPKRNILTNPLEYRQTEPMIGFNIGKTKSPKTEAKAKRKQQNQSRKKNRSKRK